MLRKPTASGGAAAGVVVGSCGSPWRIWSGARLKPFPESGNQEALEDDSGSASLACGAADWGGKATHLPSSTAPSRMII